MFLADVFEIMTFDFYLQEKRQLKTTVYMNASNEWMKKWKNQPIPHPILGVTTKYVCYITTRLSASCKVCSRSNQWVVSNFYIY